LPEGVTHTMTHIPRQRVDCFFQHLATQIELAVCQGVVDD
jgi:hypothetical protein